MNMKFAAAAALGLLSCAAMAPQAAAADNGFYLGAGLTQTNFDISFDFEGESVSGDEDDNGFKVIAGFRPLDWFAVEANYLDLGGISEDGLEIDTSALTGLSAEYLKAIADMMAAVNAGNFGYFSATFFPPATQQEFINVDTVWLGTESAADMLARADQVFADELAKDMVPPIPAPRATAIGQRSGRLNWCGRNSA